MKILICLMYYLARSSWVINSFRIAASLAARGSAKPKSVVRDSVSEDHSGWALTDRDCRLPALNHIDINDDLGVTVVSIPLIDHFSIATSILGDNQLELAYVSGVAEMATFDLNWRLTWIDDLGGACDSVNVGARILI
jgi:hypothetical protein